MTVKIKIVMRAKEERICPKMIRSKGHKEAKKTE